MQKGHIKSSIAQKAHVPLIFNKSQYVDTKIILDKKV